MSQFVVPANAQSSFLSFNMSFQQGLKSMADRILWPRVAMRVPSSTTTNIYPWLQTFPIFREWLGPRVEKSGAVDEYRLTNRDWEVTVPINVNQFDDDQIGLFAPTFQMMGEASVLFPDQQIWSFLESNPTGYDGLSFFNASHPVDSKDASKGTYSNTLTLALTQANFDAVYGAFRRFKGPNGQPMGYAPDTLFYPPELRGTALALTQSRMIAATQIGGSGVAAVDNYNAGSVTPVEVPYLTDTNAWYLAAAGYAIKPMLYQVRSESGIVQDMSKLFDEKIIRYGADKRAAFGVSFPFLMIKSDPG